MMLRLNGLYGGIRQAIRNAGNPIVRSSLTADNEEDVGKEEKPDNSQEKKETLGFATGAGCLGVGTAATIAATRELIQLAKDAPPVTDKRTQGDRIDRLGGENFWLNSLNHLTTTAWTQPTLITGHRVLPAKKRLPHNSDIASSSLLDSELLLKQETSTDGEEHSCPWLKDLSDACVQTEPEPSTSQKAERTIEELKDAEIQFEKVVVSYESTVHNWIGMDLVRQGLFGEAFKYFGKASSVGHFKATYNLGMCYYKGYGTTSNMTKAAELWEKAGVEGHGTALYQLGVCYLRGLGVQRDPDKGWELLKQAAGLNLPEALKSQKQFLKYEKCHDKTGSKIERQKEGRPSKPSAPKFWAGSSSDSESSDTESTTKYRNKGTSQDMSSSAESIVFRDEEKPVKETLKGDKNIVGLAIRRSQTIGDFRRSLGER